MATDSDCLDYGGSVRYFYHQDANFRVCSLTSESGAVVQRYDYDAYGEPRVFFGIAASAAVEGFAPLALSAIGNPYMHQGLRRDEESGLHENRFRTLHSRLGRFMQRDPLGYVDGMNLYRDRRNSPLGIVDPDGRFPPLCSRLRQEIGAALRDARAAFVNRERAFRSRMLASDRVMNALEARQKLLDSQARIRDEIARLNALIKDAATSNAGRNGAIAVVGMVTGIAGVIVTGPVGIAIVTFSLQASAAGCWYFVVDEAAMSGPTDPVSIATAGGLLNQLQSELGKLESTELPRAESEVAAAKTAEKAQEKALDSAEKEYQRAMARLDRAESNYCNNCDNSYQSQGIRVIAPSLWTGGEPR